MHKPILDHNGNPIPPRIPLWRRCKDFLTRHATAVVASIAVAATFVADIERLVNVVPIRVARNEADVTIQNENPVDKPIAAPTIMDDRTSANTETLALLQYPLSCVNAVIDIPTEIAASPTFDGAERSLSLRSICRGEYGGFTAKYENGREHVAVTFDDMHDCVSWSGTRTDTKTGEEQQLGWSGGDPANDPYKEILLAFGGGTF
jgi:hypothetical protein